MSDTIAAISTAQALAAIGIIRLSGDDAITIADRVFRPASGRPLREAENRRLIYGSLLDAEGRTIDLCLATVSRAPSSYTGENTVELQCHGSLTVLGEGLRSLFAAGARQALAGEFTKRAFLNGRMDLAQAEAVIDLISAETSEAAANAAAQVNGVLSGQVDAVYNSLLATVSHFQAVIDYPDEDIDEFSLAEALGVIADGKTRLERLCRSYERGRVLKDGMRAAIIGRPNAGKSSLLNALLGYERAIVTPTAGTTRDTIEEAVTLGGTRLRLSDTAGIRSTDDEIERLGVTRALDAANGAELVIAVFDGSLPLTADDAEIVSVAQTAPRALAAVNKLDLGQSADISALEAAFSRVCRISALTGEGLDALDAAVRELTLDAEPHADGEILTNARHFDAVNRALSHLNNAEAALTSGLTPDAVLTDVEACMAALGEVTGRTVKDDIVASIFSRFCVGK